MNKTNLKIAKIVVMSLLFTSITYTMENDSDSSNDDYSIESFYNDNAFKDLRISDGSSKKQTKRTQQTILASSPRSMTTAIKNNGNTIIKRYVKPEYVEELCAGIYRKALADNFNPELLIAIARGGLISLYYLAGEKMFNNKNTMTVAISSYNDECKQGALKLLYPLHTEDIKDVESIFVTEDIVDTGHTLKFLVDLLKKDLPNATIKSAALFYKNHSIFKPDYIGEETADWIVFPNEK